MNRFALASSLAAAFVVLCVGQVMAAPFTELYAPKGKASGMGHGASPASTDVSRMTPKVELTAWVSDVDLYQNTSTLTLHELPVRDESNIDIECDGCGEPSNTNTSWDAATGKKTRIYTWNGPFLYLGTSGAIETAFVKFRGTDQVTGVSHDEKTEYSVCQVRYLYRTLDNDEDTVD